MNGIIFSLICTIWNKLYVSFQNSAIKILLDKIHGTFSCAFSNSFFVNTAKRRGSVCYEQTSIICKVLRIPLVILSFFSKIASKFIKKAVDDSILSKCLRAYFSSAISIDVRFLAIIVLFASLTALLIGIVSRTLSVAYIIIAVISFLVSFIRDVRLADYLNDSFIVKLFKMCFGFENLSFSAYKSEPYAYKTAALVGIITAIAGTISPVLYALPIAIIIIVGTMANPFLGMLIAVFIAPILPTLALVGVCVFTMLVVLGHKAYKRDFSIKINRVGLCFMLFAFLALISTLFSPAIKGSIGVFGMYVIFIGFYCIMCDSIKNEESLLTLLKCFAISAAFVSVYGILQYVFKWNTQNAWIDTQMFEEATMRAYSTLANPNVLGEYLLLAIPIIAVVLINYTKTTYQKVVYSFILISALLCLVLTQSRGCWIGFVATAIIFVTYYRSALWKLLPFILIIIPFVLPQTFVNRILSIGDLSDTSTSYRMFIWLGTFNMLKDYWLGGIGLGEAAFAKVYPIYSYNAIVAPHSHNLYLQLLVESGIINLCVFVFAMLVFIKDMINIQQKGRRLGIIATALMSGVVGFLVQSLFDYTFYNYRVMCIFFMVLAFGGILSNISSKLPDKTKE